LFGQGEYTLHLTASLKKSRRKKMEIFHNDSHSYLFVVKSYRKNIITFCPEEGDVVIARLNVEYVSTQINEKGDTQIREGCQIIPNQKYQFHSGNEEILDEETTIWAFLNRDVEEYCKVEVLVRTEKARLIYFLKEKEHYKLSTKEDFGNYLYPAQETKKKSIEDEEYCIDLGWE
jgi:hypothetical protein